MPYVQRNTEGNITGKFANLQPGYAEEYLDDNDPELITETSEQIIARLDACIERHIHETIKGMGYNNIERLAVYLNSSNLTWRAEAEAAPLWITGLWEKAIVIQTDVNNGIRDIPTEQELIAEMPLFTDYLTS
jgi:hypothetical protein